jgi:hypothetical protein
VVGIGRDDPPCAGGQEKGKWRAEEQNIGDKLTRRIKIKANQNGSRLKNNK